MKEVLFSALIGTFVTCAAWAQPFQCPSPPSTSDIERSLEFGTEVGLSRLSRFLNMFVLNYKQREAITQNLSWLPNADKLYKELYLLSQKCLAIMARTAPDDEKIREWNHFIDRSIDQMGKDRPPDPIPISQAEAGALAFQWIQSVFDLRIDIGRLLSLSAQPFCTNHILRSEREFRDFFSTRGKFGQPSSLDIINIINFGDFLYIVQQKSSNMKSYGMRSNRFVTDLANVMSRVRSCIKENVISNDDYVVELHMRQPLLSAEPIFPIVVVNVRNSLIQGTWGGW